MRYEYAVDALMASNRGKELGMGIADKARETSSKSRAIIPGLFAYLILFGVTNTINTALFGAGSVLYNVVCIILIIGCFFPAKFFGQWFGYRDCPKCPNCGAAAHGRPESRDYISAQKIYTTVENTRYTMNGTAIGTEEQHVPGERRTYHANYKCAKCGTMFYIEETEDVAYT